MYDNISLKICYFDDGNFFFKMHNGSMAAMQKFPVDFGLMVIPNEPLVTEM
jgi:hypothetical protein